VLSLIPAVLYEELVFRAFLITRLATLLGHHHVWIVTLAAALFALTHGYPAAGTLQVFAAGLVWGAVFVRTRSLPRLVVSHWVLDFEVMLQYLRAADS